MSSRIKSKTAYIFGAGASAGGSISDNNLPLMKDLNGRFSSIFQRVKNTFDAYKKQVVSNANSGQDHRPEIFRVLEELAKKAEEHETIDTYARKLYIQHNQGELFKLKCALSVYFIFDQIVCNLDKRYDTFFVTLAEPDITNRVVLPDNIEFISWNYDSQVELTLARLLGDAHLDHITNALKIIPWPISGKGPRLIKLNGSANVFRFADQLQFLSEYYFAPQNETLATRIAELYIELLENRQKGSLPMLNFAWEMEKQESIDSLVAAKDVMAQSKNIVVIGYSFPIFNRSVDRELLDQLQMNTTIYVQGPNPQTEINRIAPFIEGKHINLVPIADTKQFYIPADTW